MKKYNFKLRSIFGNYQLSFLLLLTVALLFIFTVNIFVTESDSFAKASSSELGVYDVSPVGEIGGKIIPASCPSDLHDDPNYGTGCTVSNACGQTSSGTYQCGNFCGAIAPSLPAGYGTACTSSANSCGKTNQGTIDCSGTCSASTPSEILCIFAPISPVKEPPFVPTSSSGTSLPATSSPAPVVPAVSPTPSYVAPSSSSPKVTSPSTPAPTTSTPVPSSPAPVSAPAPYCGDGICNGGENFTCNDCPITPIKNVTFTASPTTLLIGKKATITWSTSGGTNCNISGKGSKSGNNIMNYNGGGSGSTQSPALSEDSSFTLSCSNNNGGYAAKSVSVKIVDPSYVEI